jgi:hypothetical protein
MSPKSLASTICSAFERHPPTHTHVIAHVLCQVDHFSRYAVPSDDEEDGGYADADADATAMDKENDLRLQQALPQSSSKVRAVLLCILVTPCCALCWRLLAAAHLCKVASRRVCCSPQQYLSLFSVG